MWTVSRKARIVCLILKFVAKNAFNIANCEDILDILEHNIKGEPENLTIIDDYLDKRNLIVETTECPQEHNVSAGILRAESCRGAGGRAR